MRGVLLVPSSSPTLSPMYDGLDVNVEPINSPSTEGTPLQGRAIFAVCMPRPLFVGVLIDYSYVARFGFSANHYYFETGIERSSKESPTKIFNKK